MLRADQSDIRASIRALRSGTPETDCAIDNFRERALERSRRVIEILKAINGPTREQISLDASQAVSVIALHSDLKTMKYVLRVFKSAAAGKTKAAVYYEAIPSLTDRVRLIEGKRQLYGTQWMSGLDGKLFFPTVEDFHLMNVRRSKFGMGAAVRPIDLTDGVPVVAPERIEVVENDQRNPTPAEHAFNFAEALKD